MVILRVYNVGYRVDIMIWTLNAFERYFHNEKPYSDTGKSLVLSQRDDCHNAQNQTLILVKKKIGSELSIWTQSQEGKNGHGHGFRFE